MTHLMNAFMDKLLTTCFYALLGARVGPTFDLSILENLSLDQSNVSFWDIVIIIKVLNVLSPPLVEFIFLVM
jgi:hypothetical protein